MSMDFLSDTDDWPEYQTVREEINRLEKEHLTLVTELAESESALRSDSSNKELIARVNGLKKKIKEIEAKLDESLSMYR